MSLEFQLAWPFDLPQMGIYTVTCVPTGQVYVGQSQRVRLRWKDHIKDLAVGRGCPRLQHAWDSYGSAAFQFAVIEIVEDVALLSEREQFYIDHLEACSERGLNTLPHVGSFKGYVPNEVTRARIGAATKRRLVENPEHQAQMVAASKACGYTPTAKHCLRIGEAHKQLWAEGVQHGHPLSQECRDKISAAMKGRLPPTTGKPRSEETKRKIGEANRGKSWSAKQREQRADFKLSAEAKQKISAARKGIPWTPARRAAYEQQQAAKGL